MLLVHQEANNSLYPDEKKSLSSSLTFLQDVISCSSAEEMLPSWGVLVSCYFIALRGNKRVFEEKERKRKWQGNNRSISIIFLHQVISRLLCHCLRFKETQGEIKQFTHSPNCCTRLYLNQMVFKAHYRQSMITHAQASISFLQQHERDHEPTNVLRTGEQQDDLTAASQSSRKGQLALTTRQSCTEGTPFSSQILHHLSTSGPLRGVQACPVLLFSPWTAHKAGRCCDSVTSCILLSLSSSMNVPPTPTEIPLFSCNEVSAHLQDLSCLPRDVLLSVYHTLSPRRHNHAWQWWPSHSSTNLILSYSLTLPTAHSHLASSLQHPKQFPKPVSELFVGRSHSWLTQEQRLSSVLFPKLIAGCKHLYEGREVTEARQPDPHLSCTARQLARVCHTSLICTQRYFT